MLFHDEIKMVGSIFSSRVPLQLSQKVEKAQQQHSCIVSDWRLSFWCLSLSEEQWNWLFEYPPKKT